MTGRLIELIRRLKRGDKNGFEEFYRLTKSAVWYVISRKLFDRQKAEDVMQETYVKFLNSLQKVDEEGNPMAYLLTIAKNKSLDEYKKNAKEQLSDEMEEHGGRADFYSPLADSPLLCLCKEKLAAEEYAEVCSVPENYEFFKYNDTVNGSSGSVASHNVIEQYITEAGEDYRFQETQHPVKELRCRTCDNTDVGRNCD